MSKKAARKLFSFFLMFLFRAFLPKMSFLLARSTPMKMNGELWLC